MVISLLNKSFVTFILLLSLSSCASECPDRFGAFFAIEKWHSEIPSTVYVARYKKDTNFKIIEEIYPNARIIVKAPIPEKEIDYLTISIEEAPGIWIPISSDYKLILNKKIEYRISSITSTNRMNLGCRLDSYQLNGHKLDGWGGIYIDQAFGEPAKKQ